MNVIDQTQFAVARSRDMIDLKCMWCGEVFQKTKAYLISKRSQGSTFGNYCSTKCEHERRKKPLNPCKGCGGKAKAKFCSRECSYRFRGDASRRPVRFCKGCTNPCRRGGANYCSNKCQGIFERMQYISRWLQGLETGLTPAGYLSETVRNYLLVEAGNKCVKCGWDKINPCTGKVPLQVDHEDGDFRNCARENLNVLCPCCHALTPTYMGLNKGRGRDIGGVRRRIHRANVAQLVERSLGEGEAIGSIPIVSSKM